ncbi:MAG: hypothetical protein IKN57_07920 [Parasporobacterium sp.]|nr:hypothetical protein [Parasporobacterium sp.]
MFRLSGKTVHDNRTVLSHTVAISDPSETRTHKIFRGVEELARQFDLPVPIWLDRNIREFKRNSRTRFTGDSFIEPVDFDYFEICVEEEE